MIPYFQYNAFLVGPVTIQVWGLMIALGILAALLCLKILAKKYFLSYELLLDMTLWVLVAAFVGARIFHAVFYAPDYFMAQPLAIFRIWEGGASSTGGFFGAVLAIWAFCKRRHLTWREFLPYADVSAVSLWLGWGIGRIGCFLIHDHPGTLTSFVGGVQFPAGTRHDLGLYESILGFVLFFVFIGLFKTLVKKRWGLVAIFSSMAYAVVRFGLDFLRATDLSGSDLRYVHLTIAQWSMLGVIVALTCVLIFGTLQRSNKTGEVA